MALNDFYFTKMINFVTTHSVDSEKKESASLGWPTFPVSRSAIENLYGIKQTAEFHFDNVPASWRNASIEEYNIFEILKYHNYQNKVLDVIAHREEEEFCDLNEPLKDKFKNRFSLIIDTGTLEHCFNVGTAFKNMCEMTKVGGLIVTASPFTKMNHGYYNFCPVLYFDGFLKNGFEIIEIFLQDGRGRVIRLEDITKKNIPIRATMMCLAKKIENKQWKWPIQDKYTTNTGKVK